MKLWIVTCPIMSGAASSMNVSDISIRKIATTPATHDLSPKNSAQDKPHLATIAKRFSALALNVEKGMSAQMSAVGG